MNLFIDLFHRKSESADLKPGLYHYLRETTEEKTRVHLRVDPDGTGTLIVNANSVMHLNPTATFMAWMTLEGKSKDESARALRAQYSVNKKQADADLSSFLFQFEELIRPDGACPIHDLNLEMNMPFSARPSAPYRMDLAITYRCNNDCAHCYNARERNFPELDTAHWKLVLDKLWELGVPHIVFTGGEATLRNDLPELIQHAESNGQITGLNTNARRLSDAHYVQQLIDAGLDHVQIT
ncbi:MAG TPA: PqqD family peptide modification chaperone, partial [Anaerolineales bacterium]|nr:PqqD family peptide modification chaperone [Anaerolineales bacterium]